MRRSLPFLRLFLIARAALPLAGRRRALTTERFANVFIETERVIVQVRRGQARSLVLRDHEGRVVAQQRLSRETTTIDFGRLPPGYFEAISEGGSLPLTVLIAPEKRPAGPSRASIDAALLLLVPPRQLPEMARLLRLCGFAWVRERTVWLDVEPERGRFRWKSLDAVTEMLARQGLRILETSHSVPPWTRADGESKAAPDDLRDAYRFAQALKTRYSGRVWAWEPWNEPDIVRFFKHPASEISAFQKAVYLGFRHAASTRNGLEAETPLVLGPSQALKTGRFAQHLLADGTGHYLDVWNQHIYSDPSQYTKEVEAHRALLERHGVPSRQWATEVGAEIEGPGGMLNPEGRSRQAAFVGRSYAAALTSGLERSFWFVFPFYHENRTGHGVFEPDQRAAFPALAALSTATFALGRGEPLGRLEIADPATHVLCFDRGDGTASLVVWRDGEQAETELPLERNDVREIRDHLGSPLTLGAGGVRISAASAPVYLIVASESLRGRLQAEPSPARTTRASPPGLFDIVVRLRPQTVLPVDKRIDAYVVVGSQPVTMEAQLYNFGPDSFEGRLRLAAPYGWKPSITDLPVAVKSGGRVVIPLQMTASDRYEQAGLTLVAVSGERLSAPSTVWMSVDPNTLQPQATLDLGLDSPTAWKAHSRGDGRARVTAGSEGGVRLEMEFVTSGDNFAYAAHRFEPLQDFSAYNALQFEYRTTMPVSDIVRLVMGDGEAPNYGVPLAPSTGWQLATILFDDMRPFSNNRHPETHLDRSHLTQVLIGIHPSSPAATVEIRNIRAIRLPESIRRSSPLERSPPFSPS